MGVQLHTLRILFSLASASVLQLCEYCAHPEAGIELEVVALEAEHAQPSRLVEAAEPEAVFPILWRLPHRHHHPLVPPRPVTVGRALPGHHEAVVDRLDQHVTLQRQHARAPDRQPPVVRLVAPLIVHVGQPAGRRQVRFPPGRNVLPVVGKGDWQAIRRPGEERAQIGPELAGRTGTDAGVGRRDGNEPADGRGDAPLHVAAEHQAALRQPDGMEAGCEAGIRGQGGGQGVDLRLHGHG
mmetsp:Transcript_31411/g.101555  ORF Transcript_31411/g.101555 Transcript_31411/m.101555 type:complete len:240 (+) Transcript_31411:239-958(+)|eukprot:scaffold9729_cov108-Isochrysis_galbana.AAC.7